MSKRKEKDKLKWNYFDGGRIAITPDRKLVIIETNDYIEKKRKQK